MGEIRCLDSGFTILTIQVGAPHANKCLMCSINGSDSAFPAAPVGINAAPYCVHKHS